MELLSGWYIVAAALALDLLIGDPETLPHPVRWMGRAISASEPRFRRLPFSLFVSGLLWAITLILLTWGITWGIIVLAEWSHPWVGRILEAVLLYYCISVRSLEKSALAVYGALKQKDLPLARTRVGMIVGRDTWELTEDGVSRGAIETLAENFVDGILAPLFFAALAGVPGAMAYKMVNTLDSMAGYKNETYRDFGRGAARIDDAINFIPARISIPVIAAAAQILFGRGLAALKTAVNEGGNHLSPNAGYPEAAFAGTLKVKLNGPNFYGGRWVDKPYIGIHGRKAEIEDIKRACALMRGSAFLWSGLLLLILFALR